MIQSIERAFSILNSLSQAPEGRGVSELARALNLPKSTVSRMLSTLEHLKVVEREKETDLFRMGPEIVRLAAQAPYQLQLITIAHPYIAELASTTRETANLCVLDGEMVNHVDQVYSQYHVQIRDWTGFRTPLHCASNGKIFLAYWPEDRREEYLSRPLKRFTPHTIADPDVLRQELAQARERGFAWGLEELEEGLVGVSAPVFDPTGTVIAAVNLSGPAFRFPGEGKEDEVVALTVETAKRVTNHLGVNWSRSPSLEGDGQGSSLARHD